jgi:hypothetical protein
MPGNWEELDPIMSCDRRSLSLARDCLTWVPQLFGTSSSKKFTVVSIHMTIWHEFDGRLVRSRLPLFSCHDLDPKWHNEPVWSTVDRFNDWDLRISSCPIETFCVVQLVTVYDASSFLLSLKSLSKSPFHYSENMIARTRVSCPYRREIPLKLERNYILMPENYLSRFLRDLKIRQ